ncbi:PfkB family carbohydrate kinase [Burkholderia sp. Ac-20392]|uniref:PfkB family carbohydrate kinase n=1 Tax=Burkholderia sp. Ac-20392 TaxID=2703905 RepID=UPI00197FD213|nr:PfkB family carbohydrate kinase [Burkholderia sp. Ac-20392]MBN3794544.1 nucleoside 2-deoxyribosyltransferase [Burkholderia sp. Ac-20392]
MSLSEIAVVGGVYHEKCIWPDWDQIVGSGGRAAIALRSHVDKVTLHTYAADEVKSVFERTARFYDFDVKTTSAKSGISFEYVHCMSTPVITPTLARIPSHVPILVTADVVLRFGMLEGSGLVDAKWCVYDPQSAFCPEPFWDNGSKAQHLAIVANRSEIIAMAGIADVFAAAQSLINKGAEVVVVKSGPVGAFVYTASGSSSQVPAYQSSRVWTIGSGDVFAAIFAAQWAVHHKSPEYAANIASLAVSQYAEMMALPVSTPDVLAKQPRPPATTVPGRVYLASPFFTLGQRWLVDEARRSLEELGLCVFSPVHEVGHGPAHEVGPKDIEALESCDRVFAIVDGLDAGTIFEVGYARAKNLPVYALAQAVSEEDLKMATGTECCIYYDFVTALHHTAWKT